MRMLIRGGTVVTATGSSRADVLIDGETIAALLDPAHTGSFAGLADRSIDATGKYVIPGGIDVHTHLDMPFGGTFSADDFETGTRAAAWGGTTSLVDFAVQAKGASLRETLDAWHVELLARRTDGLLRLRERVLDVDVAALDLRQRMPTVRDEQILLRTN